MCERCYIMYSKEFMTYLLNIDSENTPKKVSSEKEIEFKSTKCSVPVYVEIINK